MKFYKFKLFDVLIVAVLFIAGYTFTVTQKFFLPPSVRLYTYLAMVLVMYYVMFMLIKPKKPMELANALAAAFGIVVFAIIIVQDIIIKYQLSWRTPIIFLAVVLVPYLTAWAYKKLIK